MACFAMPYGLRYAGHCSTRAHAQQGCRTLIRAGGNQGVTSAPSLKPPTYSSPAVRFTLMRVMSIKRQFGITSGSASARRCLPIYRSQPSAQRNCRASFSNHRPQRYRPNECRIATYGRSPTAPGDEKPATHARIRLEAGD